ncbi:hypothetical protein [Nocardioides yefusunii]|uniref:Uncharacterized protein n=1 Tax=Nocardioides yefusunii TaxID=2500546 RepID=A0ABW1QZA6_9ACTN|nr:hypothetical protein [Nocardioides yefusunii]
MSPETSHPSRRTLVRTAAWTAPAVAFSTAAPAFASSADYMFPSVASSVPVMACSAPVLGGGAVHPAGGGVLWVAITTTLSLPEGYTFPDGTRTKSQTGAGSILIPGFTAPADPQPGVATVTASFSSYGETVQRSWNVSLVPTGGAAQERLLRYANGTRTSVTGPPTTSTPLGLGLFLDPAHQLWLGRNQVASSVRHALVTRTRQSTITNQTAWNTDYVSITTRDGVHTRHPLTGSTLGEGETLPFAPTARLLNDQVALDGDRLQTVSVGILREITDGVSAATVRAAHADLSDSNTGTVTIGLVRNGVAAVTTAARPNFHSVYRLDFTTPTTFSSIPGPAITPVGLDWFLSGTDLWRGNTKAFTGVTSAHVSSSGRLTLLAGTALRYYSGAQSGVPTAPVFTTTVSSDAVVLGDGVAHSPTGRLWYLDLGTFRAVNSVARAASGDLTHPMTNDVPTNVDYLVTGCA